MFKIFVTIDKQLRFKSFVSQTTSVRLKLSSSNSENLFVSNVKIPDYFFKLQVTIVRKPA